MSTLGGKVHDLGAHRAARRAQVHVPAVATPDRGTIDVISPMWPSEKAAHYGVFVKNVSEALAQEGFTVRSHAVITGKAHGLVDKTAAHLLLGARIAAIGRGDADYLYVHAPAWFSPLVRAVAMSGDKRVIVHLHGTEVFPKSLVGRASRSAVGWLARRADLVVAPSRYYAREVQRAFAVAPERLFVSPSGGVDTSVFAPLDGEASRRALNLPTDAVIIGFVGRIFRNKGWDTFLQVLAALRDHRPRVLGLVVGDGDEIRAFKAEARALGVTDRLIRFGITPQQELPRIYASMDVLLFPTRRAAESLGLVPIEAMAVGVPVVASRVSAVPEYVQDGETGTLCPPYAVRDFVAAVLGVLERDAAVAGRIRAAGIDTAKQFDRRIVATALAKRIEEIR